MGKFNSDEHYIDYCGQVFLRRNEIAFIARKIIWNKDLGAVSKIDRMISVRFQCKPVNITIIQVYAPTTDTKET